jgi:DNA-binding HxlR family transcriptional regulator
MVMSEEIAAPADYAYALELCRDVIGCKWTLPLLIAIGGGEARPGRLRRTQSRLSVRMLNEHLRRLLDARLIARTEFPEVPPRVEYRVTRRGQRLLEIVRSLEHLAED